MPQADFRNGTSFSFGHLVKRQAWNIVWMLLFRPSPRPFHAWRALLLRAFGAKLGARTHIYAGAVIWAPWNLECGDDACIADGAEIYNVSLIRLEARAVVSQGAYLCAASHDYTSDAFPLITKPITIGERAWVCARAIVLMGVTVGKGSVIAAGSVVTGDVPARVVCGGNPAKVIKIIPARENA